MIAPRWRKVLRDIAARKGRSSLAVLAMAAGIFQITTLASSYALLRPALTTMYGKTRPASATLVTDAVSDALVDSVRRVPGVTEAEARPVILARARLGPDEWVPTLLYVIRDFDRQRLDTFVPERGAWRPGPGEVLLERTALSVAHVAIGDSLVLRTTDGEERALRVSGTVHAAGLPPAWMEHMVPAFVGWDSRLRGSAGDESAQIRIAVAHPLDEGFVRETADSVKALLERQGHLVARITIPPPGRHPHADQMEAFLFLLLSFGVLGFALSTIVVATMIHALMAEQVKQVGIMKAIGATSRQVAGLYLGQVAVLAGAALALGVPLGLLAGRGYAGFSAGILNTDVADAPFPLAVVAIVLVVGLLVPLAVALGPVRRAAGITVREALADDPAARPFGERRLDRWLARLTWLSRPLALTLRTTFRRRRRLAMTVGMLAVGGAAFLSALNTADDWTRSVDADFARRRYDLMFAFAERQPIAALQRMLAGIPGVARAEYWPGASPYLVRADGVAGTPVSLVGPDPGSTLVDPQMTAGHWLREGDPRGAVVNGIVLARVPGLAVGDSVRVRLRGRTIAFPVVGVLKELSPMPLIYAPRAAVLEATGASGDSARSVRIVTRAHDDASERAVARAVEHECEVLGIEVSASQRMQDARKGILDHLVIILSILTTASLVVVLVGTLGLTSALTLSVVQRTREIGVLGAIGATPATLARHLWIEAVLIGALSWLAAVLLAVPLSWGLEAACGNIFFKAPLDFYLSPRAAGLWLLLVLVLASLSSFYPARRAARLTVREALGTP